MIAKLVKDWRNGDGGWVAKYELSPPFEGNETVIVTAWRAIGGRFVTAVIDKKDDFLSKTFDGTRRHRDALASIGYDVGETRSF